MQWALDTTFAEIVTSEAFAPTLESVHVKIRLAAKGAAVEVDTSALRAEGPCSEFLDECNMLSTLMTTCDPSDTATLEPLRRRFTCLSMLKQFHMTSCKVTQPVRSRPQASPGAGG